MLKLNEYLTRFYSVRTEVHPWLMKTPECLSFKLWHQVLSSGTVDLSFCVFLENPILEDGLYRVLRVDSADWLLRLLCWAWLDRRIQTGVLWLVSIMNKPDYEASQLRHQFYTLYPYIPHFH